MAEGHGSPYMDGSAGNRVSRRSAGRTGRSASGSALRRAALRLGTGSALTAVVLGSGMTVAHASVDPTLGYDAVADKGSLYNVAEVVGAHDAYRKGLTGKGVGVGLIDTGVAVV